MSTTDVRPFACKTSAMFFYEKACTENTPHFLKNIPPKSHGVIDLHQLQLVSARKGISQHRIVLMAT